METVHDSVIVDEIPATRRSLRLAVVTETYPPEVNGVAATLAQVVEGLHQRNHAVQLIRPRQFNGESPGQSRFHEVLMRGLPIPRYPGLRMGLPSKGALARLWSLSRPDIVHIATEGPLGWSALQAARRLKLPVSTDFRTNFQAYSQHYGVGWLNKPILAYLRKFHNLAHCTMVPTEAMRRDLQAYGFQRLHVVSRGVDAQRFDPARRSAVLRAQWGANDDDLVVACVGRLAPEKNLELLLSAFEAIERQQPRAKLLLVGDGPLRAELQARCPQAIFAGQRTGDDLATHYASADLFLFASVTESFGNVTTEAMASGLPVVAFHSAAAAQLIRAHDNGFTVPLGDQRAFVATALALAIDPAQRREIGQRARRSACELGWDAVVARFETVVESLIASGGAPADAPLSRLAVPRSA
ncbi:MAG TPA: glycosyltransferase family 1 protein [Burkholderiaceae bacterium]